MSYNDLVVLIPSHSLEDFPTELNENEAEELLNAFAVLWHPALLASAGVLPSWHRADEPPEDLAEKLVVVPSVSSDWLPGGWADHARLHGATVLDEMGGRGELLAAALENLDSPQIDAELAADFLALGTCHLQVELLTRHMRHFSNLDEVHLQQRALAAAKAALAEDAETAGTHLQACFEALLEARERFYPVECYLIDLCLLIPELANEHLARTLERQTPFNLMVPAADLRKIADEKPELAAALREAWQAHRIDLVGGELCETPLPLMPVESIIWQLSEGRRELFALLGRLPLTWGRRRFGPAAALPQLLTKFGYAAALHLALDDGLYPDAEHSKIRWEGCDGTAIDAMTRIPLAADSAVSYLRFPVRMSESMDQDQVAAVTFARWPEVKAPWFDDFHRINRYAPVLGRFVTLDDFFDHTESPGRVSAFDTKEYFSPFLLQSVARREADPISRFAKHADRRRRFDAADWCRAAAAVLVGRPVQDARSEETAAIVERAGAALLDGDDPEHADAAESCPVADAAVAEFEAAASRRLAEVVLGRAAGGNPGYLLVNTLSHARRVSVELPDLETPPAIGGPVKGVQFDEVAEGTAHARRAVTVELPGAGFVWLPAESPPHSPPRSKTLLAEELQLRNELFEVSINARTGGLAEIRRHGTRDNRLSQQLAYRFPTEREVPLVEGETARSHYSEMCILGSEIISDGPGLGELATTGEIIDQAREERLAQFRQVFRVWRGRNVVEIDVELSEVKPPEGDPWSNAFVSRFAFNDSTAAITRSVLDGAHGILTERFESSDYVEIAADDQRTTIVPHGLAFHRKTGMRMLDTLLVAAGETRRRFRFTIVIDDPYPLQAARAATTPVVIVHTTSGPPPAGQSGWFFHLDAKNIQLTRILGPALQVGDAVWDHEPPPPESGFAVRLVETEGRARRARLRCFKTPQSARLRDFQGRTITELTLDGEAVIIDMTAYEIADVELRFDA